MQRPGGVVKVRPPERAQVRAAGQDDAVHVVVSADRTDRDGGDSTRISNPVCEWSLVTATEARLLISDRLTCGHVNRIHSVISEGARDLDRVFGGETPFVPINSRHPYRHRFGGGPH
jgi:hypothetical protein